MTTADYLTQLEQDREDLVDNLETKGITGLTGDETFTELVPEVLNIPSGSGGIDWSTIGYSEPPESIENDYNYALQIKQNWDTTQTSLQNKFQYDTKIVYMPLVDTSNATTTYNMFNGCTNLTTVPLLNTSNVTNMRGTFSGCSRLVSIPLLDTSSVSGTTGLYQLVASSPLLSNDSLENILKMCINATSYTGTKTLERLGLNSTNYPASRIQALPSYQNFINAGWTIGY